MQVNRDVATAMRSRYSHSPDWVAFTSPRARVMILELGAGGEVWLCCDLASTFDAAPGLADGEAYGGPRTPSLLADPAPDQSARPPTVLGAAASTLASR